MASYTKLPLSGSNNGKQILITATTSGSAQNIHTAISGSGTDEIFIYAYNDATSSIQLSILWGGVSEPADVVRNYIPGQQGRVMLVDGKVLQGGFTVQAYVNTASFVNIDGFVNRIQ